MKTTKAIQWAFPASPNAVLLGFPNTGCWHVIQTHTNIEGSGQCRTFTPHDAEGFAAADDPDLIAVFREYNGAVDQAFLNYGNKDALAALGL
jgi:hypothetical protein